MYSRLIKIFFSPFPNTIPWIEKNIYFIKKIYKIFVLFFFLTRLNSFRWNLREYTSNYFETVIVKDKFTTDNFKLKKKKLHIILSNWATWKNMPRIKHRNVANLFEIFYKFKFSKESFVLAGGGQCRGQFPFSNEYSNRPLSNPNMCFEQNLGNLKWNLMVEQQTKQQFKERYTSMPFLRTTANIITISLAVKLLRLRIRNYNIQKP